MNKNTISFQTEMNNARIILPNDTVLIVIPNKPSEVIKKYKQNIKEEYKYIYNKDQIVFLEQKNITEKKLPMIRGYGFSKIEFRGVLPVDKYGLLMKHIGPVLSATQDTIYTNQIKNEI